MERVVIHTPTQEEFDSLLGYYEKLGWKWFGEQLPLHLKSSWKTYKENTCVQFNDYFRFGSKPYFKVEGYTIIPFSTAALLLDIPLVEAPVIVQIGAYTGKVNYQKKVLEIYNQEISFDTIKNLKELIEK